MALTPRAEVLARNLPACSEGRRILVDVEIDDLLELARDGLALAGAELAYHDHGARRTAEKRAGEAGISTVHFGLTDLGSARFDRAILSLPQGREARSMIFDQAARALEPAGSILVVGETRAGIRPARESLAALFGKVESIDVARRCALLQGTHPHPLPPHADPLASWFTTFHVAVGGADLTVASLPGVFSHGELDEGTRALLNSIDVPPQQRVLDMGCGCGVIGAWLQQRWPEAHVDLVDVSALAVASARRTAAAQGMPAERVWATDVFSDVPAAYDWIVSNPPFHRRLDTDWSMVERFLGQASKHLNPGGRVRFVANAHLAYAEILNRGFPRWRVVHETDHFLVYEASV